MWYGIQSKKEDTVLQKIDNPVKNNLSRLIADFKTKYEGQRTTFLVKANNKSKYNQFEQIIDALRENNEFKYNLITTEN